MNQSQKLLTIIWNKVVVDTDNGGILSDCVRDDRLSTDALLRFWLICEQHNGVTSVQGVAVASNSVSAEHFITKDWCIGLATKFLDEFSEVALLSNVVSHEYTVLSGNVSKVLFRNCNKTIHSQPGCKSFSEQRPLSETRQKSTLNDTIAK